MNALCRLTPCLLPLLLPVILWAQADVGITVKADEDKVTIAELDKDGAAADSREISTGDTLLAIGEGEAEMTSVAGKKASEIQRMLEGKENSEVRLRIVPSSNRVVKEKVIALQRKKMKKPEPRVAKGSLESGTKAPPLVFTHLATDEEERLADYQGKVVVLMFWATWFPPSQEALQAVQEYRSEHPEWGDKVELIAFSTDRRKSSAARMAKSKDWKATRNVWGAPEARKAYNPKSIVPTVYIIDAKGHIAASGHPASMSVPSIVNGLLEDK